MIPTHLLTLALFATAPEKAQAFLRTRYITHREFV